MTRARIHVTESNRDVDDARRIVERLKAHGYLVSVDYEHLLPGMEWRTRLKDAVAAADGLVAIFSEHSVDVGSDRVTSQWMAADIGAARAAGKFVLPVVLGGPRVPIPTLVDDLYTVRLDSTADTRRLKTFVAELATAIESHVAEREAHRALNLPPGYQHLASAVLRAQQDVPYDQSVFVMMKYADRTSMTAGQCAMVESIWSVIQTTLDRHGLVARRADKHSYADQLWENLCAHMLSCRYGIAVLEGRARSELNPNVMLEYGFMKAHNRQVVLLRDVNFEHDRADLLGKLSKPFEIDARGRLQPATLRKSILEWLRDLGIGA